MPKSEAKKRADAKFNKKTYDHLAFIVRRDSELNGDFIRAYAAARGETLNGFIKRAIAEAVENDKAKEVGAGGEN